MKLNIRNMLSRTAILYLALGAVSVGGVHFYNMSLEKETQARLLESSQSAQAEAAREFTGTNLSGNYLNAYFAQRHHDWRTASRLVQDILARNPGNPVFLKRAMVLAMGAGEPEKALDLAAQVDLMDPQNPLSKLFLAIEAFKSKNYDAAASAIHAMPAGGLSDFIMPLLYSWASAALGKDDTALLGKNAVHLYHAILIADYMKKPEYIEGLLREALAAPDIAPENLERIADIYAHLGKLDQAKILYEEVLANDNENKTLADKLEKLSKGKKDDIFVHVTSPEEGVAEALYDMARILAQEYNDESARVFGEMALYLNPHLTRCAFLLAEIAARNDRFEEAVEAYRSIAPEDATYVQARRAAAEILNDHGKMAEALAELEALVKTRGDIDSLLQIGDIYRINKDFDKAIAAYNDAEKRLGGQIPAAYWQILYLRGMAYEQSGDWKRAERDLEAALAFQPHHPYVLNYLGYAWTDKGMHLDKALGMIEKAANLRPDDGYITDSLGWVFYRLGQYKEAVPNLEQAVALMPYDPVINDHLGDAYWQVGRHMEARFQWQRAKNYVESGDAGEDNAKLVEGIDRKLDTGLPAPKVLKEVRAAAH